MENEEENFLRNLRVLVECGNETFREVLRFELSQQNVTLEQFLSKNRHDIYHRFEAKSCCQCSGSRPTYVRQVFQKAQLDLLLDRHQHMSGHNSHSTCLFCCSPVKSSVTLDDLDATLIRSLLTNFGINYQKNIAIKNDAEKLIKLRNKYAHISDLKISDADFTSDKTDIINTIRSLISLCGGVAVEMDKKISDSYQRPLDKSLLLQHLSRLIEDLKWQDEIKETLDKMQEELERLVTRISENIALDRERSETNGAKVNTPEAGMKPILKCTKTHKPEVKKIVKNTKKAKKQHKDTYSVSAIKNLRDQSELMVNEHEKDQSYVVTTAVQHGLHILEEHNLLFLVAKRGSGKTEICLELASRLRKKKMTPLILSHVELMSKRDLINPFENYILIIEDFCCRKTPSYNDDIHGHLLNYIKSWVSLGNTKVVMTITAEIDDVSDMFQRHSIFKGDCVIDIDNECPLNVFEKFEILSRHAKLNSIRLSENICREFCNQKVQNLQNGLFEICPCLVQLIIATDTHVGFPQCCAMFCRDKFLTQLGIKYFCNPSTELVQRISTQLLEKALDGNIDCLYQYVLMVYMAITGCALKPKYNQEDALMKDELLLSIFKYIHESTVNIRAIKVNSALTFLKTSFLKNMLVSLGSEMQTVLEFQHFTINDAVLLSFGGEYPDKVIKFCDVKFITDFIFPKGLGPDTENPTDMISVDYKLVLNRFHQLIVEGSIFNHTDFKKISFKEEETKTLLANNEKFLLDCEYPVLFGSYLKQYSGGNEKPVMQFIDDMYNAGLLSVIEYVLCGLSDSGTFGQFLTTFPSVSNKYLLAYGGPSVFSGTVRPTSSISHTDQFVYVNDPDLIQILLNRLRTSNDVFKIISEYEIGQYVGVVANEGNSSFLFRAICSLENTYIICRFLDGCLLNPEFYRNDFKILFPVITLLGSTFALISCCRPLDTVKDVNNYLVIDRHTLLELLRERSEAFFVDQLKFHMVARHYYNQRCFGWLDFVGVFFERCFIFSKDVADDEYVGKCLEIILNSMKTVFCLEYEHVYTFFIFLFCAEFCDVNLYERYPMLIPFIEGNQNK